jgi:glucose-6-phosphate 1-dehydrogenase
MCHPTEPLFDDCVHQLAVPPSQFTSLADKLLVIEKPFGKDSASAKEMMDAITKDGWKQEEIYRIDHFIGDEMVRIAPDNTEPLVLIP